MKQVYNVGLNVPGFGRQLTALFRQAVTAGKRVRSETSIAAGAVSVSSAAAELAQLKLPSHDWSDAKVPPPHHHNFAFNHCALGNGCFAVAAKCRQSVDSHLLDPGMTSTMFCFLEPDVVPRASLWCMDEAVNDVIVCRCASLVRARCRGCC